MTTTEKPGGIDEGKPSSRVLRPPGGASSFSLGIDAVEERPPRQASSQGSTDTASPASVKPPVTPDNPPTEGQSPASTAKAKATSHSRIFGDPEPASPVCGRDLARGEGKDAGNPVAGGGASKPKPQPQQQQTQEAKPFTKVRQPPGGFSHGIF